MLEFNFCHGIRIYVRSVACCKFRDGDGMGMESILTGMGGDGYDFCPCAGL